MAQSHIPSSIEFTTQHQIDNFPIDFPGCTDIEGDVTIRGPFIDNLAGLVNITRIGGDLKIGSSGSIISFYSDLMGLNNLTTIEGNLEIMGNGTLERLLGLEKLTSVGGDLIIDHNPTLKDISALRSLSEIRGDVTVSRNESLIDLAGLNNLTSLQGNLAVSGNPSLISLKGLENTARIHGFLEISDNSNLLSLEGLEKLSRLEGSLDIENNDRLLTLSGLDNLDPLSINALSIVNNASLASCEVSSISGFLARPSGKVEIYHNAKGCNTPSQVADRGNFTIDCLPFGSYNFHCQQDIDQFTENYTKSSTLSGNVVISGEDITHLTGLRSVTSIHGNLVIFDCDQLESLAGLENLLFVERGFFLGENEKLVTLKGLDNLSHIGEFLEIDFNESLESLQGLENLVSAGATLRIEGNRSMTSLVGLENLRVETLEHLIIINNFNLGACDVGNLCTYTDAKDCRFSIFNNGDGCRSLHEVELACRNNPVELVRLNELCSYYKEPETGKITFSFELDEPMEVQLVIYDRTGLLSDVLVDKILPPGNHEVNWQPEGSPTGIYFYSLTAGMLATAGELLVSR